VITLNSIFKKITSQGQYLTPKQIEKIKALQSFIKKGKIKEIIISAYKDIRKIDYHQNISYQDIITFLKPKAFLINSKMFS